MRKIAVLVLIVCFLAVGCSGMSYTAQRTLSGGAMGAAGGAAIGAIAGNPAWARPSAGVPVYWAVTLLTSIKNPGASLDSN